MVSTSQAEVLMELKTRVEGRTYLNIWTCSISSETRIWMNSSLFEYVLWYIYNDYDTYLYNTFTCMLWTGGNLQLDFDTFLLGLFPPKQADDWISIKFSNTRATRYKRNTLVEEMASNHHLATVEQKLKLNLGVSTKKRMNGKILLALFFKRWWELRGEE